MFQMHQLFCHSRCTVSTPTAWLNNNNKKKIHASYPSTIKIYFTKPIKSK
jgi:hypothetical protein